MMTKKKKHNKKRNTAFLYETLIMEYTKASMAGESERKEAALAIVKKHFSRETQLYKELKLYQALLETRGESP